MLEILRQSLQIVVLVFLMMLVIDFIDVKTRGHFRRLMKGGPWRQYTVASFLGATPGCLGAFMNVSMYIHGFLSFGAIVAGMIATSGDEAFVMLAKFPRQALLLFGILFVIAIPLGWLSDLLAKLLHIVPCKDCDLHEIHEEESVHGHYLQEHVWKHIVKRHIWRVFLWTFFALLMVHVGLHYWQLEGFVKQHIGLVFLLSVLIGVIPESGPHFIFVMMYAEGLIPFSVLLASSISQDGHGMLPLLSYTIRDALLIKVFNIGAALLAGGLAYWFGW
ncbi:MAG: arsenic efflux protein [candidate division KSB1 bacterium]|nr:arsenic efflux protein [candidate division KSB1 bacterium]MDZ7304060.1 arsenic efflux protein [candidate division KSB1 bacterium]